MTAERQTNPIIELHQGLRVLLQADTPRGRLNVQGEIIYVSNHHFRLSCDTRVPANALKKDQEMKMEIEDRPDSPPILVKFLRPLEEGSHVLIFGMPTETLYRNRRAFFRGEIGVAVSLKRKNGEIFHGTARNISGGGLLISIPESLPKGEELEADILFSDTEVINATVRVVRTEKQDEEINYGVKFLNIRRRDQDRICRMVIVQEFENRRHEIKELNETATSRP